MNGAGVSPTGDWKFSKEPCRRRRRGLGGVVGVAVCVCELLMGHIGYISFKNQKHLFLYHQGFRKKRLLTPSGLILGGPRVGKLYPSGSFWTSNLKVAPANI